MKKLKISFILLPLILGILIYVLYRSRNLFYYNLINYFKIHGYVNLARQTAIIYRNLFPTWVIYSLPDGLWLFSAGATFLLCRNFYLIHIIWYSILYVVMIIVEYIQKFYGGHGTIIGTFDKNDIFSFSVAYILIILISFVFEKFNGNYLKNKLSIKREIIEDINYTIIFLIIGILPSMI